MKPGPAISADAMPARRGRSSSINAARGRAAFGRAASRASSRGWSPSRRTTGRADARATAPRPPARRALARRAPARRGARRRLRSLARARLGRRGRRLRLRRLGLRLRRVALGAVRARPPDDSPLLVRSRTSRTSLSPPRSSLPSRRSASDFASAGAFLLVRVLAVVGEVEAGSLEDAGRRRRHHALADLPALGTSGLGFGLADAAIEAFRTRGRRTTELVSWHRYET